jgi:SAM-dependent methyltransferase
MHVFAADALIRFRNGRILIHTTASSLAAFETDNPMLIGWLCQLAKPLSIDAALNALQPDDRAAVAKVVNYLQRSGALVEAQTLTAQPSTAVESNTRDHLRLLSRSIYDLACDLLGHGVAAAESGLANRSGLGVERRLMALLAATDGLRSELKALRPAHVAAQMLALKLDTHARGLKLHIGCGKGLLEGWVNIDISPAPLSLNVMWGLPFEDGSVSHIFVSHLLEHLFFPRDVMKFFAELRRVLAPAGILRVVVPDIEKCMVAYGADDRTFFDSRRETWSWWPENPTRLEDFLGYAGAGAEPAYLFESHKYGYDFETLKRTLTSAGFDNILRSEFMSSDHGVMRVDDISEVAKAKYGDSFYSLFVEATRAETVT